MNSLLDIVKNTISKHKLISYGASLVIGVSGGADSLCLLHVIKSIRNEWGLKLYAVHLNHMFRGAEAEEDALFVRQICKEWDIPAFIETFDVPAYIKQTGLSPEEAGREIRYRLFEEVRQKVGADKIAVAQNLNDNVETVLMRFLRGTGIEGLKGIEAARDNIIRPLLEVERSKIEDYCNQNQLLPRIDKTNLQTIYSRNKIRLELIPYIKQNFNPSIENAMTRLSSIVKDENDYLETQAEHYFSKAAAIGSEKISYNINDIENCHTAIKRRIIRLGILRLTGSLRGYDSKNIELVLDLIGKKTGSAIELPKNIKAYISYNQLILTKNVEKVNKKCYYNLIYDFCTALSDYGYNVLVQKKQLGEVSFDNRELHTIYIDEAKIKNQLILRTRQQGDIFSPIGMSGSKKLKDYFIDEKIPKDMRDQMLVVADGSDIVWVVGKRISEKYKITSNTKDILMISITKSPGL